MKEPEYDVTFVRNLDTDFLECRNLRHAWKLRYFGKVSGAPEEIQTTFSPNVIVRQAVCTRCECLKETFYSSPDAHLRSAPFWPFYSRYRHPRDYLWRGKEKAERPTSAHFAEELYERFQH